MVSLYIGSIIFHQDQYASVGQMVTIKSHLSDSPKPVYWDFLMPGSEEQDFSSIPVYHDGRVRNGYEQRGTVDNASYDLTIYEVELGDSGEYLCTEQEGLGNRHVTRLRVTGII